MFDMVKVLKACHVGAFLVSIQSLHLKPEFDTVLFITPSLTNLSKGKSKEGGANP